MTVLLRPKMCEITFLGSLLGPVWQGVYSQAFSGGGLGDGEGEVVVVGEGFGGMFVVDEIDDMRLIGR